MAPHMVLSDSCLATQCEWPIMSPTTQSPHPLVDYQNHLSSVCPMSLKRWRTLKALFFSSLLAVVAALSILHNADATVIGAVALVGIILTFGLELKEVDVANLLTVTFKNGTKKRQDKQEDE